MKAGSKRRGKGVRKLIYGKKKKGETEGFRHGGETKRTIEQIRDIIDGGKERNPTPMPQWT